MLGDAANPTVVDAWTAARGQLAGILHAKETEIYRAGAAALGGWIGFLPFQLERRMAEGMEITAFTLCPEDSRTLPPFLPGQYVSVKARPPNHPHEQIRQYSLTHAPNGRFYRIAVRSGTNPSADVPAGFMSFYLHGTIREGGTLLVHMPLDDLVLDDVERPVVLLSGGSGITPMLAMLDQLTSPAGRARQVVFVHAARRPEVMGFGSELAAFAGRRGGIQIVPVLEQDDADVALPGARIVGRISAEVLGRHLPKDADVYSYGPLGFTVAVEAALDGLQVRTPHRHSKRMRLWRSGTAPTEHVPGPIRHHNGVSGGPSTRHDRVRPE